MGIFPNYVTGPFPESSSLSVAPKEQDQEKKLSLLQLHVKIQWVSYKCSSKNMSILSMLFRRDLMWGFVCVRGVKIHPFEMSAQRDERFLERKDCVRFVCITSVTLCCSACSKSLILRRSVAFLNPSNLQPIQAGRKAGNKRRVPSLELEVSFIAQMTRV